MKVFLLSLLVVFVFFLVFRIDAEFALFGLPSVALIFLCLFTKSKIVRFLFLGVGIVWFSWIGLVDFIAADCTKDNYMVKDCGRLSNKFANHFWISFPIAMAFMVVLFPVFLLITGLIEAVVRIWAKRANR